MVGILCEKPSAARAFGKALGGMKGKFNGEDYVIVNSRGHLYELDVPENQVPAALKADYHSWALEKLPWDESQFAWKRVKQKDTAALLKDLKATLGKVDEIALATDVDPSGEGGLLGIEILLELNIRPKKFTRMYFTDESAKSVQEAFKKRVVIPDMRKHDEFLMAWYRSRWDFLSMQFTRIATKCGDGRSVLRQGRLKSAMVLLVGDQLKLANGYKKIPFYENRFKDENGVVYSDPNAPRFKTEAEVPGGLHSSAVVCDSKLMKKSGPPRFLDLAGLSSMLAAKGFKPKDILATYQKMYEYSTPLHAMNKGKQVGGIVSYPRTEDKTITPEQFNDLLPYITAIAKVVGVDPRLLTHQQPRSTHVKAQGAHGANRPGLNVPNSLDELKQFGPAGPIIYETLAKNYLASLAEDYEYEAQKGHVKDYPSYTGGCSVPKKPGWKAVFNDEADDDEDTNNKGLGSKADPFVYEGFPPKPAAPTMKWLMKQLESRDVGTGATRTSTLAEVTNEKSKFPLMVEKRGKLTLSEFGEMSYQLLPGTHIGDLGITERVQKQMKEIAAGKLDPEKCLREMQQMVKDDIVTMQANGQNMRKELGKTMGGGFADKEYYEGTFKGKQVKFNRTFRGKRLDDADCDALLAGKEIEITDLTAKSGSKYGVRAKLNPNLEYNGRKYCGIEQLGFLDGGGSKGVPDEWCGHKFTDDEKTMLEAGAAVAISDAVSRKTGKTFSCKVTYGQNENGRMGIIPEFN